MPFADSYNRTIYINEDVQPTGTPDVSAATLNNNENFTKLLSTAMSGAVANIEALQATVSSIGTPFVDPLYIAGLFVEWESNTSIRVKPGACYTPASGSIGVALSDTVISPTLAADTWYYVYAANVSGTLSFQVSTTKPEAYMGPAKRKTSDGSYRYVGEFRTHKSLAQIIPFRSRNDRVGWIHRPISGQPTNEDIWSQPWQIHGGTSVGTSVITVQATDGTGSLDMAPHLAKSVILHFANYGSAIALGSEPTLISDQQYDFYLDDVNWGEFECYLNNNGQFGYRSETTGSTIDFYLSYGGYTRER